jgi:hypothetical protein
MDERNTNCIGQVWLLHAQLKGLTNLGQPDGKAAEYVSE